MIKYQKNYILMFGILITAMFLDGSITAIIEHIQGVSIEENSPFIFDVIGGVIFMTIYLLLIVSIIIYFLNKSKFKILKDEMLKAKIVKRNKSFKMLLIGLTIFSLSQNFLVNQILTMITLDSVSSMILHFVFAVLAAIGTIIAIFIFIGLFIRGKDKELMGMMIASNIVSNIVDSEVIENVVEAVVESISDIIN